MKSLLFRATESAVGIASCLVLFGGVASAQSISDTGPDSTNVISTRNDCTLTVRNDNDVDIVNNNPQSAESGESSAEGNTTVGTVGSGNASNNSSTDFSVVITNDTASCVPAERPTPVTPSESPSTQVGGRGGGEVTSAAQVTPVAQVVVPQGGVGAGSGGPAYLSGLVAITVISGAWAAVRLAPLARQVKGQF